MDSLSCHYITSLILDTLFSLFWFLSLIARYEHSSGFSKSTTLEERRIFNNVRRKYLMLSEKGQEKVRRCKSTAFFYPFFIIDLYPASASSFFDKKSFLSRKKVRLSLLIIPILIHKLVLPKAP